MRATQRNQYAYSAFLAAEYMHINEMGIRPVIAARQVSVRSPSRLADSAPSRETATPVASSATEAAASAVERTEAGSVADLVVTVAATPNRPGLNAFTVTAASSRRPAPRPIDTVSLEVVGAKSTVSPPLQPIGAGRYFGVARLDSGPVREMRAVIERNGEQLGVTVPWTVSAATDTARLAPYVNTLAASLAVAFLGPSSRLDCAPASQGRDEAAGHGRVGTRDGQLPQRTGDRHQQ